MGIVTSTQTLAFEDNFPIFAAAKGWNSIENTVYPVCILNVTVGFGVFSLK